MSPAESVSELATDGTVKAELVVGDVPDDEKLYNLDGAMVREGREGKERGRLRNPLSVCELGCAVKGWLA